MTIDGCVTYLALHYKEPLKMKIQNKEADNVILINAKRWFHDNFIDGKRLEKFCYYILDNYKPTTVNPYPTNGHLTELYNQYQQVIKPQSQNKYISFDECQKIFAEKKGIRMEPPEQYKDLNIDILAKDEKENKLTSDQMLRKYGIVLCGELWSEGVFSRAKKRLRQDKKLRRIF